jgi:hypothetical protein
MRSRHAHKPARPHAMRLCLAHMLIAMRCHTVMHPCHTYVCASVSVSVAVSVSVSVGMPAPAVTAGC